VNIPFLLCNYLHLQVELIIIRLFLVQELWVSYPEQINFTTPCQRLTNAATLKCGLGSKPWTQTVLDTDHS